MTENTIQIDSRKIRKGDTFICLPTATGHIEDALSNGAAEVLKMDRKELANYSNDFFKRPSEQLVLIGVTGTNGKTTVCDLIRQGLERVGHKVQVLGTIYNELTTPESIDIQRAMADHVANGGTHFVMEVSSHGIDQGRVDNMAFDIKVLTNITQDHLDYHKTLEHYSETKHRFMREYPGVSIYPETFEACLINYKTKLIGEFNKKNIQAASLALKECGLEDSQIASAMATAQAPPGRFETIDEGQDFTVIVDYAHTPDSLDNVLRTSKAILKPDTKLLTLFGCGGDRDRKKRPLMGKIATEHSDYVVITQDNPRTEDETQIVEDIQAGISEVQDYKVINDRGEAIVDIISYAKPGDIVMIAGKGHETYQVLKGGPIDFDDRAHARDAIKALKAKKQ